MVARARAGREAYPAAAGAVPAIEQVLLRQGAKGRVDDEPHATRGGHLAQGVGRGRLEVREHRAAEGGVRHRVDAGHRVRAQALDLRDELHAEPAHGRRGAAVGDRLRHRIGVDQRARHRAELGLRFVPVGVVGSGGGARGDRQARSDGEERNNGQSSRAVHEKSLANEAPRAPENRRARLLARRARPRLNGRGLARPRPTSWLARRRRGLCRAQAWFAKSGPRD